MDKFEQFIHTVKSVKLKDSEKSEIKNTLVKAILEEPVRSEEFLRHSKYGQSNPWFNLVNIFTQLKTMPVVLMLALMFGGGVSAMAEKALPGDALYPVKVSVNENVRGFFALNDAAEADWNIRLVERRLEEGEQLASEGRLDNNTIQAVANFQKFADQAQAKADNLEQEDPAKFADINMRLQNTLDAHAVVFEKIASDNKYSDAADKSIGVYSAVPVTTSASEQAPTLSSTSDNAVLTQDLISRIRSESQNSSERSDPSSFNNSDNVIQKGSSESVDSTREGSSQDNSVR